MPLTSAQFADEAIYRQIKTAHYINGQAEQAKKLLREMNQRIAKRLMRNDKLETKSQYAEDKKYIRKRCVEYRDRFYGGLQNDLRAFAKEQAKWVYANSPVKLEKKNIDAIMRNVNFEAFSDVENIRQFAQRVFNQAFQLWNAQLTIAYRTGQLMSDLVALILGEAE